MPKSKAERHAAYVARHGRAKAYGLARLDMWISGPSKWTLAHLAICYGISQRQLLERVLEEMQEHLEATFTSDEQKQYDSGTLAVSRQRDFFHTQFTEIVPGKTNS